MAATRHGGLNLHRTGARAWSWVEVAVLGVLVERFGYRRPDAGRLLRRNPNETAGAYHRYGIKLKGKKT